MSDSLAVELRESRSQLARDFPEVEVALASRARVISNGTSRGRPLVMAAVLAYRSESRQLWGPVLLDLMAPAILASLQRLREQPPVVDAEDLSQYLILEVLSAAAEMPLPATPSYMRRRLMARANQGVRRRLERESRRQRRQRSFETLEEVGEVTSLSSAHPWPPPRELTAARYGNSGFPWGRSVSSLEGRVLEGPLQGGSAWRKGPQQVLETLGVPRDGRGIVLLCGYVAACAVGLIALLTPPNDPIGWAYIALAVVGYFFIQTRGLTTFLWLVVAAGGAAIALAGGPSGWVEFGLGLALAIVGLVPVPTPYRFPRSAPAGQLRPEVARSTNGDSSRFLEDSPTRTSRRVEESEARAGEPRAADGLEIHGIGRLRLFSGPNDLASSVEDKPVLDFLFKYLLTRCVIGQPPQSRDALAEELSPGLPESSRRKRLRKQIYDLQKDLAPPIAALIHATRTNVWLELDRADFDVDELRHLANRIRQRGSMIDAELAAEINVMLDETEGQEFLPGFEELESKVNGGKGTAGDLVAQARELIGNQRAELVHALAEYQEAIGHPEAAIAHLQATLEALPARQDIARQLVVAYLRTGQTARASEVRRQYPLTRE